MTHKISELNNLENDKVVTVCGLITSTKQIPTKKDPTKFIRFITVEDLTGKAECLAFNSTIAEYGEQLQNEQRVIISGKISRRGDTEDQAPTILIDNVKSVDNSNIFTLKLKNDFKFEELVFLKDKLCEHKGSDPVMLKVDDDGLETKILTASMFWVNASNDLVNSINKTFSDRIDIEIKSMDTKVAEDKCEAAV